jgi:uncharacterized membrane protein YfhO
MSGDRQPFTPAEWVGDEPGRVLLRVETTAPGLLVVGETWMPGWTARVDGRSAPVLRGNHFQRVVPLPSAGRHEILMEFDPPGWKAGIGITTGAIGVWGVLFLLTFRPRRRLDPAVPLAHPPLDRQERGEE